EPLRGHVQRGAGPVPQLRGGGHVEVAGDPEVDQVGAAGGVDQDVIGLDVAVGDVRAGGRVGAAGGAGPGAGQGGGGRRLGARRQPVGGRGGGGVPAAPAGDQFAEGGPLDQGHGQEGDVAVAAPVLHR